MLEKKMFNEDPDNIPDGNEQEETASESFIFEHLLEDTLSYAAEIMVVSKSVKQPHTSSIAP